MSAAKTPAAIALLVTPQTKITIANTTAVTGARASGPAVLYRPGP